MKRISYLISVLLISFSGYGQQYDHIAKEYFINGCEKVSRKNYTGAINDFSEVIKRAPGYKQAYENRGVAKYYLHDFTGAIDDYSKALEIDPNDYNTYGRRGWAEYYLQDYSKAIADFTSAMKGNQDNSLYYNIRGQCRYWLGEYEGAIADLNIAIKSRPGDRNQRRKAYYYRGLSEIDLGQKESGCIDLNKAGKLGNKAANAAIEKYCKN